MSSGIRAEGVFPYLALAALAAAFIQVTLGGVVRVTGSGLGCPDWPLCDGRVIPVFERSALVEFSHRVVAMVVAVLTLSVAALAVRRFRAERGILVPSLAGAVLVLAAAALGAVVVWTELSWWVRLIHLGIAEGVVASMVVAALAARRAGDAEASTAPSSDALLHALILVSAAGVFLVILSGSYMVGYGAGSSCGTWPLCRGSLLPDGAAYVVHMFHRLLSAAAAIVLAGAALMAWRRGAHVWGVRAGALLAGAAMAVQIVIGAWTVWSGFPIEMRAAHLAGATLLWAAVVGLATLYFMPRRAPLPVTAHGVRLAGTGGGAS